MSDEDELKKMSLHSVIWPTHTGHFESNLAYSVLRVVGGWIYCFEIERLGKISLSTTFVPDKESK